MIRKMVINPVKWYLKKRWNRYIRPIFNPSKYGVLYRVKDEYQELLPKHMRRLYMTLEEWECYVNNELRLQVDVDIMLQHAPT